MNKDEVINELKELIGFDDYHKAKSINNNYREGVLDATDLVKKLTISDAIGRLIVKYRIILYQHKEYMVVDNKTDLSKFRGTVDECVDWLILHCDN